LEYSKNGLGETSIGITDLKKKLDKTILATKTSTELVKLLNDGLHKRTKVWVKKVIYVLALHENAVANNK